ncbi:MAG: GNAT family N-acetyltransferase [Lachnoclostridium sp.]|nr:GNAT family N-acetyltransferase [Lachnoclostridium sp.]MCM1384389.1 GNAT family N-acetyltransferase [Lachnoclostridium sp.]
MIKAVEKEKIPECVKVIHDSFITVADAFGFTAENAPEFTAFATTEERLNCHMSEEHRPMYAFYDSDVIVGYYSLLLQENKECELCNLCVIPSYRHKGIGRELLLHAFMTAQEKGCSKVNIGVVDENTVVKKWYETFGFVHIGAEKLDFFPFTYGYMVKEL